MVARSPAAVAHERAYNTKYMRKWRAANADKVNARRRAKYWADPLRYRLLRLARQYGLTLAEYTRLIQDGCAVCGSRELNGHGKWLAVDHDHATGKIRGALCSPCNTAIGLMGDDPERAYAIARYLSGAPRKDTN